MHYLALADLAMPSIAFPECSISSAQVSLSEHVSCILS